MPLNLVVVLGSVSFATFAIALSPARKEAAALAAAAFLMVVGHGIGFFPVQEAFASISIPVIVILVAIGIFAEVFAESGLFDQACRQLVVSVGGRHRGLIVAFLVLVYAASTLLNNLTCLYVLLPLMLGAMRAAGMTVSQLRLVVVAIVIASNLGGASTMIGDFPNILIARSNNIPFVAFLAWMLPACVLMLWMLVLVAPRLTGTCGADNLSQLLTVELVKQQGERVSLDRRLLWIASGTFGLFIIGLLLTTWFPFPPELIALACACLCIWLLPRRVSWLDKIDLRSALFLVCLFVFAGAVESTGALNRATGALLDATRDNPYFLSAAVITFACVTTAVFSAGPTTAALIPAADEMQHLLPGNLAWWCLSLGVLAGSSATLLSATAGPIAANLVRSYTGVELRYSDFLKLGLPNATLFLVTGILYVWARL